MIKSHRGPVDDDRNWKLRVAISFILGHMIILVLPFFSVIFLLMDILGEGTIPGHLYGGNQYKAIAECIVLILLIITFFLELITMFSTSFAKLVILEVLLEIGFMVISFNSLWNRDGGTLSRHTPLGFVIVCCCIKIICAVWSKRVESVKKDWLQKRRPGKAV